MPVKRVFDLKLSQERPLKLAAPPGLDSHYSQTGDDGSALISADAQLQAKQRQIMAIAYSPGKSLLTTAFMLWMSGSSVQIFSIMMTGMSLMNPLKAIFTVNKVFERFKGEEGIDLRLPKLLFIALQILSLAVALYKTYTMGLLPVTSADWTSYIPDKVHMETSGVVV